MVPYCLLTTMVVDYLAFMEEAVSIRGETIFGLVVVPIHTYHKRGQIKMHSPLTLKDQSTGHKARSDRVDYKDEHNSFR